MVCYSHSRVSTFENCPYKYKLQYIERKKPDIPTTIEPFMGDMVHQTLEHLYKLKMFKKRIALNSLIKFYRDIMPRSLPMVKQEVVKLILWKEMICILTRQIN